MSESFEYAPESLVFPETVEEISVDLLWPSFLANPEDGTNSDIEMVLVKEFLEEAWIRIAWFEQAAALSIVREMEEYLPHDYQFAKELVQLGAKNVGKGHVECTYHSKRELLRAAIRRYYENLGEEVDQRFNLDW